MASVSAFVVMTGLLHAVREVSGVGVVDRSTSRNQRAVSLDSKSRQ